jgi:catechol 2,3-dioxygenase-like lactoylglutathione lyase family enzyme
MDVNGLVWGGTRTESFDETVMFFGRVMGLDLDEQRQGFVSFRLPNGDKFEVFGPEDRAHTFFTTGPVVGFGVDDVDAARKELESSGVEFLAPTQNEGAYKWAHFRGPDGNIYEIGGS